MTVSFGHGALPLAEILLGHTIPVDRRITEQDAKPARPGERHVDCTYRSKELLVDWSVKCRERLCRVLPDSAKRQVWNVLALDKPVHDVLIQCVASFNDDVVHRSGESGIANKGQPKRVALLVAVVAFTEGDDLMGTKRVDDG